MNVYRQELLKILYLEAFNNIVIVALTVVAIIFCFMLKRNKIYKYLGFISSLFLVIMIFLSLKLCIPLYKDISNDNYIVLENVSVLYPTNKFDSSGIQEIIVQEENNNTFALKTTKKFDTDIFKGTIVYSKNSRYLISFYSEDSQSD